MKSIAEDFEAALVVDETGSGCYASGNGQFWQYNGPADYVAFGKRTQAAGYFHKGDGITTAGNENDVQLFNVISQGISQGNLAKLSSESAQKIGSKAESLSSLNGITGVRSSGTSIWVDTDSESTTNKLIAHLRTHGVIVSQNGSRGIVARPSLMFGASQADEFLTAMKRFS